jgi:hypothetical protein
MTLTPGQVSGMINASVFFSILPEFTRELMESPFYPRIGLCRGHGGPLATCKYRDNLECVFPNSPQFPVDISLDVRLVSQEESQPYVFAGSPLID